MFFAPPPPPGPGPGDPSPFVTDTLQPLVGSRFTVLENKPWDERYKAMSPQMRKVWDQILRPGMIPAGQMIQPDTVEIYRGAPDHEHTLTHESGHVWVNNGPPDDVVMSLVQGMQSFKPQSDEDRQYLRTQAEYAAEGFSRALQLLRKTRGQPSDGDLSKLERNFPGVTRVVQWMQSQPPFGPAAK